MKKGLYFFVVLFVIAAIYVVVRLSVPTGTGTEPQSQSTNCQSPDNFATESSADCLLHNISKNVVMDAIKDILKVNIDHLYQTIEKLSVECDLNDHEKDFLGRFFRGDIGNDEYERSLSNGGLLASDKSTTSIYFLFNFVSKSDNANVKSSAKSAFKDTDSVKIIVVKHSSPSVVQSSVVATVCCENEEHEISTVNIFDAIDHPVLVHPISSDPEPQVADAISGGNLEVEQGEQ